MKFAIIGSAFTGNKGAAAMLEASIQTLSKSHPGAEFILLSISPKRDREINPYSNLHVMNAKPLYLGLVINTSAIVYRLIPPLRPLISKFVPEIKIIKEANVLLDQGGITFSDGREKFLLFNVASILPAVILGTKVVKCAQALGPFNNKLNQLVSKWILPKIDLIIARGKDTLRNLDELKLTNTVLGADYAFALKITKEDKEKVKVWLPNQQEDSVVVGLSPSVVVKSYCDSHGMNYEQIISEFINFLIEEEHCKVILVPHSVKSNSTKTHNNDMPLCRNIYDRIRQSEGCIFVDEEIGSQGLRYIIGQCDLFLASRFHAMISSLSMGVPTMVVGWSHKYAEVLSMFNMQEFAIDYSELGIEELTRKYKMLSSESKSVQTEIGRKLPQVIIASERHVDYINRVMKQNANR